jgi:hypothetical protein
MSFKSFLKKCITQYFIITTCITAAIGILGMNLEPTARFGYEAYFSPLLFGLISVIPSFAMYARKELSFHQILIRKIIHVILLETLLIIFGIVTGLLSNFSDSISFALAVFAVYLIVNVISWQLDLKEAGKINDSLKTFQGR